MELIRYWAAVQFSARNGGTEALLSAAAQQGLHLFSISPLPGGFCARCAAWHYLPLSALARRQRIRLRVQKRLGLFFKLRRFLRRNGVWCGFLVFLPLIVWAQGFVWAVDVSSLSTGQAARADAVLREVGLQPGAIVTQEILTSAEYALLKSGEFSWASVNFSKGRLEIEAAPAAVKPDIAAGSLQGIRAKCSGIVTETNLISGTMLVAPGQEVQKGDALIGTARSERDGTLIFSPAAGSVQAQFAWESTRQIPLEEEVLRLTGQKRTACRLTIFNKQWALPAPSIPENACTITRHYQPELLGLLFPCTVEETTYYEHLPQSIQRTEEQALALARMQCQQELFAAFPDAEVLARQESVTTEDDRLSYTVVYTICADICT